MELLVYDGADINEEYNGGYTQMFKLGFRKGDSAEKIMITLL